MLEKSMYESWASCVRLFIKGKIHGRMMLDSIDNGLLVYPTVKENRQTRPKKYSKHREAQQLQDDCDVQTTNIILHGLPPDVYLDPIALVANSLTLYNPSQSPQHSGSLMYPPPQQITLVYAAPVHHQHHHTPVNPEQHSVSHQPFVSSSTTQQSQAEFPQLDSSLAVPMFQQGEDQIECINKAMAFLSAIASSFPSSNNQLRISSNPINQATIQDGRVTVQQVQGRQNQSYAGSGNRGIATTSKKFFCNHGISEALVAHKIISQNSAFQTKDLDAYDSDCDDLSSVKAILMDVQEMQYSKQTYTYDFQDNKTHSDSNTIFYSQYLQESQNAIIQDTNSFAPNDLLVLSLVEQMTDHVAHLDKENQTNKMINESLTAELVRYKKRVTIFEQRLNRIQPKLYDGSVIAKEHTMIYVTDDEETLISKEGSRSKMLDKQNDPISIEKKINISPIEYSKLNKIKEDFGKHFVTKKELSPKQAFWLKHSSLSETPVKSHTPVRIKVPSELPKLQEKDTVIRKLKDIIKYLMEKEGVENIKKDIDEIETINTELEHSMSVENSDLNAQLQEKVFVITTLKNKLRKLKGKNVVDTVVSKPNATIAPGMFNLDIKPISPRLKNNRDAHEETTIAPVVTPASGILVYSRRPKATRSVGSSSKVKIVESITSNSKEPKKSWGSTVSDVPSFSLNDCSKFLGIIRFENDHIAKIIGYEDYQMGNITISQVYYMEGLGHNLFSMDLGKLKPKADIRIFVGYAPAKKAFRIYNKRTRMIIETIHVDFDKLTAIASEQFILGPRPKLLTLGIIRSGLVPNISSLTLHVSPIKNDWEILFELMFDEYLNPPPCVDPQVLIVIALELAVSTGTPFLMTIDQDAPSISTSQIPSEKSSPVIPLGVQEADHDIKVAHIDNNPFVEFLIPETNSKESATQDVYVSQPDGFVEPENPNHVYKLKKALYGLKQAPRAWYDLLSSFLLFQKFPKAPSIQHCSSDVMDSFIALAAFADADHAGCQDTRKSTSGSIHLLDIFTKPLARERFEFLIKNLGMQSMFPKTLKKLADEDDE
uniref:Retrovirus-related Pol polyprotein from transposon TNT 1-94 n=1 Tax=Tanacetum cinerariifolium TaxID=118510 RepID=A0A6L2LR48_TANCI|nr:retrovirus-related Pol polyprotein from transposon TNT 1-94 [Tanacetum cinerariifolium]